MSAWKLMPPRPGVCQECAVDHEPNFPHNQTSVYYQYHFYFSNGRWPLWIDAMKHCDWAMKNEWATKLEEMGIIAWPRYHNWGNPERMLRD